MKKICIVSTVELPIRFFMIPHLRALQDRYDLTVAVDTSNPQFLMEYGISARVIPVPIRRNISLLEDLRALARLTALFREERFHVVHSIAPKAGLLTMVAGILARVPRRLHWFTGQVWANSTGLKRLLLKNIDRLTAACATHLLADSHSQRDFLIVERVAPPEKLTVLANGSVKGVDLARFRPDDRMRAETRLALNLPLESTVVLYLGRLNRDKGVLDLANALTKAFASASNTYALFVGPDEANLQMVIMELLGNYKQNLRFVGYTDTPEHYMMAADLLCLPSYREGFGMVIIESAAVGIPALASRIYGITDALVDNKTGLLHAPGVVEEIAKKLVMIIQNKELRDQLGTSAKTRVLNEFSQQRVVSALLEYYKTMNMLDVHSEETDK